MNSFPNGFIHYLLYIGCLMLLMNIILFVFVHKENDFNNSENKNQVIFKVKHGSFKIDNIKRGASIIGSAGSGKTESVVFNFLEHFCKYSFCGVIHDYKNFEITEMAYPLFKRNDIDFRIISFDTIYDRVNPIAPRYMTNEESVNELARVLIENLLEQRESGSTGTTKFFNDAAEGLIGGLIWKLR
ncbi:MAG: type IV secretory system conjugative DNA transfer family protein, partial [Deltaproteobacteria bacterium]|nr:type IV secretory system conjugative DNA transfer family protein [Deltaproteobacteria bacterium]